MAGNNTAHSKTTQSSIFGKPDELPKAVQPDPANDLLKPNLGGSNGGEYIPYTPVSPSDNNGSDGEADIENMFSKDVNEAMFRLENESAKANPGNTNGAAAASGSDDEPEESFFFDEMDAEMFYDTFNEARVNIHDFIYKNTIGRKPKEAEQMARDLARKRNRTSEETDFMEALWKYIDEHKELKTEYLDSIPYSERHKSFATRYIQYKLKKLRATGKTAPEWLIVAYLLVLPEVKAGLKLSSIASQLPTVDVRKH